MASDQAVRGVLAMDTRANGETRRWESRRPFNGLGRRSIGKLLHYRKMSRDHVDRSTIYANDST